MPRLSKYTRIAVAALEEVKGRDIVVFDVKKATAEFDSVVVVTGDSNRQCRALANRVCEEVKAAGGRVYSTEGEGTGEWVLVDLGDTVVHVMQPAIRQHYNLEELWAPAPKPPKPPKPSKVTKVAKASKTVKTTTVKKPVKSSKKKAAKKPVARKKRVTS